MTIDWNEDLDYDNVFPDHDPYIKNVTLDIEDWDENTLDQDYLDEDIDYEEWDKYYED